MTDPKRPESLDRAVTVLEMERRLCDVAFEAMPWLAEDAASLEDALDVLRAERKRRELEEAGQMRLGEEAE